MRAFTAAALALVAGGAAIGVLGSCSKATASLQHDQPPGPAHTCADASTLASLKSIIFDNAAKESDPTNRLLIPELGRQSTFKVSMPVLESYDKETLKTSCSGQAEVGFPSTAASAIGTEQATQEIRYTAQPTADGSGVVVMVYGAEPLISGIATTNLEAWRSIASSTTGEGAPPSAVAHQTETAAREPAQPTAAELLRDDPQLQARDQAIRGLYENALERDATGQVRADQEAALAARATCRSKACLQSWFDRRESALKAWQGG